MAGSDTSSWFIINTKPKQEFIAGKNLKSLEVEIYLPLCIKKKKKDKLKVEVTIPLFPGYIFAKFSIVGQYHKVRYTKGVKCVLGNNDYLWTIDEDKINDIKSREDNGYVILKPRIEFFQRGDKIIIDEGNFDGWEGIFFEELPDKERAVILLTNLGYSSKMIIPQRYLTLNK